MLLQAEWRPFDRLYVCSRAGVLLNKRTGKVRPVEDSPRPADPHKYVRLVLKESPNKIGSNNQKRVALRNAVAHCWLPGFELGPDGEPTGYKKVYQLDRDPKDCRAANLAVLTEQQARQKGLALTSRQNRAPRTAANRVTVQGYEGVHNWKPPGTSCKVANTNTTGPAHLRAKYC
jgi:hypothetical protein